MQRQRRNTRNAFTLIELVIVLVILVGLAGIVIAMLPSMITRTHGAAGAANINEVAKWVQTYEAINASYPNRWDALLKSDGTAVAYFTTLGAAEHLNTSDLTAAQADALLEAGITEVYHFSDTPAHATFDPYATAVTAPTAVAANMKAVALTAAGIIKLNLDATGQYVVLGLGGRNTLVGKGILEAPVHFPENADDEPASFYARFGVVFKVGGATPLARAFPVAVVSFHDDELSTGGDHQAEYWNAVTNK